MTWSEHTIWWHVYPLGFADAPVRPKPEERVLTHRLPRLLSWLDYVVELGANGLLLGPIFDSSTHGYDTVDFYRIDPRLGDDSDFDALIEACRERGIRVMLDGVFNHVGAEHPAFRAALAGGAGSPESALFRIDHATGSYVDFEGHGGLAALDHSSPAVADLVVDVMLHWLRRGVDAWRLDAAYAVPPGFWVPVLERVRAEFPEVWIMGEVLHGDYGAIVAESTFNSVTQYELWKAIWSSLADANVHELDWGLTRHNEWLTSFVPYTFIGNHDVTRIATKLDAACRDVALLLLFVLGGIPSVYYGDEQGFVGEKTERLGGDDDVRPGFPDSPTELSPLGESTYRLHQQLIGLRRRHPWLTHARTETVTLEYRHYVFDVVGRADDRLRVVLDLRGDTPVGRLLGGSGLSEELFRVG